MRLNEIKNKKVVITQEFQDFVARCLGIPNKRNKTKTKDKETT